jgi:methylglyoxal synthase
MNKVKTIALVAHDARKKDLVERVEWNWENLVKYRLVCTGTTGKMVEDAILQKADDREAIKHNIIKLKSGPLGGDQQLGAMIADGKIDLMIFLWDPMTQQPHDVDVKALLRIAVLYNLPNACNRYTADFLISSPLLDTDYRPKLKDFSEYINRFTI